MEQNRHKKYHRNILHKTEAAALERMTVYWTGKPSFLSLFFTQSNFWVWIFVMGCALLMEEEESTPLIPCSGVILLCVAVTLIQTLFRYTGTEYFLTTEGPVVKQGRSFYLIKWGDIMEEEYRSCYYGLSGKLLRKKTFEFSRCYLTSQRNDSWKYRARFWCIKDYEEVERIIKENVGF
ncbi:MAG: hypothetical protein J6J42_14000 [Lachnospiraceae bacterium]|nr:hypothetical protein [Lachnospiraceae bacterium]